MILYGANTENKVVMKYGTNDVSLYQGPYHVYGNRIKLSVADALNIPLLKGCEIDGYIYSVENNGGNKFFRLIDDLNDTTKKFIIHPAQDLIESKMVIGAKIKATGMIFKLGSLNSWKLELLEEAPGQEGPELPELTGDETPIVGDAVLAGLVSSSGQLASIPFTFDDIGIDGVSMTAMVDGTYVSGNKPYFTTGGEIRLYNSSPENMLRLTCDEGYVFDTIVIEFTATNYINVTVRDAEGNNITPESVETGNTFKKFKVNSNLVDILNGTGTAQCRIKNISFISEANIEADPSGSWISLDGTSTLVVEDGYTDDEQSIRASIDGNEYTFQYLGEVMGDESWVTVETDPYTIIGYIVDEEGELFVVSNYNMSTGGFDVNTVVYYIRQE